MEEVLGNSVCAVKESLVIPSGDESSGEQKDLGLLRYGATAKLI